MVEPNATLTYRKDLNEELIIIRIAPDAPDSLDFEPGQYIELGLINPGHEGKIERRQYSIASARNCGRELELYVVLVPGGFLTSKLWLLENGARVWVNPKVKGKFTLEGIPPGKDLVMVSTGTGLAPFVSMYLTYRADPPWGKFIIVHGVRYSRDLGYRDELVRFMAEDNRLFYLPTVTRETGSWDGHRGRVQSIFEDGTYETITGSAFEPAQCQIFLCGNPDMIDSMEAFLIEKGFRIHKKKDPGQIHVERYW